MYLTIKDFIRAMFKSVLIVGFIVISTILIDRNIVFANYLCNTMGIPKDLSITMMSFGFANEVVFLSSLFEIGIILYIYFRIINNRQLMNLYYKIMY